MVFDIFGPHGFSCRFRNYFSGWYTLANLADGVDFGQLVFRVGFSVYPRLAGLRRF